MGSEKESKREQVNQINNADWCCSLATGIPNLLHSTNIPHCSPESTVITNSITAHFPRERTNPLRQ
jgi:hypothetical protein